MVNILSLWLSKTLVNIKLTGPSHHQHPKTNHAWSVNSVNHGVHVTTTDCVLWWPVYTIVFVSQDRVFSPMLIHTRVHLGSISHPTRQQKFHANMRTNSLNVKQQANYRSVSCKHKLDYWAVLSGSPTVLF
jgi:hypothetical protein